MIFDAQLESLRKASQVKLQDSPGSINFSIFVSIVVNVLKGYRQVGYLQSSATLHITMNNLPQVLTDKWWFWFDDRDEDWPDLIMFE